MSVPDRIKELTETFDNNLESYKKGIYNETQVRREYIDPFFEELGWDVVNKQGYAEAYKDVIHEDAIKVGGVTKAPDYCFRIGGVRRFFLEAKRPSVNIQEDIHPAYQLRRYGWSAKLPLSILTDFEEFAVYDCRVKPAKTDKVSHSRIFYIKYTDYADRWEEIAGIFAISKMGSSLLLSLDSCLLIKLLCPERRSGITNVRRARMKISITFWNLERNIDQELRVDLTPLIGTKLFVKHFFCWKLSGNYLLTG